MSAVEADSPAEKVGVEPGDVITRFDGGRSRRWPICRARLGNTAGQQERVDRVPPGRTKDLTLTIAEVESDEKVAAATAKAVLRPPSSPTVADPTAAQRKS